MTAKREIETIARTVTTSSWTRYNS